MNTNIKLDTRFSRYSFMRRYEIRRMKNEAGYTLMDVLGGLLVGLIVIAGVAVMMQNATSKSKLSTIEQNLAVLRMQTQQMFSGQSDYTGLNNALAINAGLAPKVFVKGTSLVHGWNGSITLAPDSDSFSITMTGIPAAECTQLALFQTEEWTSVTVNGGTVTDVASASSACSGSSNTIVYVAR